MNFFISSICLLDKNKKIKLFFVFIILFLNFFFELLGISILIPLFNLIFNNNDILNYEFLSFLKKYNFFSQKSNSFYVFIIIFFFLFKVFWSLFFFNYISKFTKEINIEIGKKYFQGIIEMPYNYFSSFNSAKLIKNTVTDINYFSITLYNFIVLFNEVLIFLGFVIVLLIYDKLITTYCIIFFLFFFIFQNFFSKKIISQLGETRNVYLEKQIKTVNEFFGNIIQVKLRILDLFYNHSYNQINRTISKANQKIQFINNLPKIFLEFCFIFNFFIIYYLLDNNIIKFNTNVLSTIALYFAFFLKVIPSANRISNASQSIAHMLPIIDAFVKKMRLFSSKNKIISKKFSKTIFFTKSITYFIKKYRYKKNNNFIINRNIKIFKNKINLMYGKSGSGKTTFLNILSGLLKLKNSHCSIDNNIKKMKTDILENQIFYLPQNINLTDGSIQENITVGFEYSHNDKKRLYQILKMVNLKAFVNSLPKKINNNIGERGAKISGGQIQRIAIARALYSEKPILIFDEFTNALDVNNEILILKIIKKLKKTKTIILSSHSKNVKNVSDIVYYF
jgi:ABC-type bacteriocin/lantibiotic exporter with double-glycine peptidase domain